MRHESLTDQDRALLKEKGLPLPPAEAVLHRLHEGLRLWVWKPEKSVDDLDPPEFRWVHYPHGHRFYPRAGAAGFFSFAIIGWFWKNGAPIQRTMFDGEQEITVKAYNLTTE